MRNRASQRARIALTASLALLAASYHPGRAEPAQTTWTTYLRAGPGLQYAVIDEVETRSAIDVQGCSDGWCRVVFGRAFGYIAADLVAKQEPQPAQATASAPPPVPCFDNRQSGYGVGDVMKFCGR